MRPASVKPPRLAGKSRGSGVLRLDPAVLAPFRSRPELGPPSIPAPASAPHGRVRLIANASSAIVLMSGASAEDLSLMLVSAFDGSGARVLDSESCTDADSGYLFQRIHADISRVPGGASTLERRLSEAARQRGLTLELERSEKKKRVAIFVSKFDHCLYDLLLRQQTGELDCEIPVVVSNHPNLERVAGQFGVEYAMIEKTRENKLDAEEREFALLEQHDVDLVVLARYMQVLSNSFVSRWEGRVINIHHSFLPAFVGARPYHQARERGVKLIGATAHYASATLDEGPIIEQDVARCTHKDTPEDLVRKGRDLERQVLARAVSWHLTNRVIVHGNRTVVFD